MRMPLFGTNANGIGSVAFLTRRRMLLDMKIQTKEQAAAAPLAYCSAEFLAIMVVDRLQRILCKIIQIHYLVVAFNTLCNFCPVFDCIVRCRFWFVLFPKKRKCSTEVCQARNSDRERPCTFPPWLPSNPKSIPFPKPPNGLRYRACPTKTWILAPAAVKNGKKQTNNRVHTV
jgi:hypothetical protein